jgi:MFS family permease
VETTQNEPAAKPVLEYEPHGNFPWRAGTLVYTSAGLVVLFCWLLWGDFAWSMKERAIAPLVPLVLKQFQASDRILGVLLVSLPAAIAVVLGPILSYRSDRHRGPLGRRIPYLLITTPIAFAAMVGLAYSPKVGPPLHHALGLENSKSNLTVIALFGSCWAIFECATIVANLIFGALVNDVVPRALMGRFFGMFRAISLIAGIIFNLWLIGWAEKHYITAFISVGLLYAVGFLLMCIKVKEGQYPPPPQEPGANRSLPERFFSAAGEYISECFSKPYYLLVFIAMMLGNLAFIPINSFSVPYAQSLSMSMSVYGKYVAWSYVASLALAYPLGMLADRFHPLRASLVSQALYAIATIWGARYANSAATFGVAFVAHVVLSGCYFTTSASLGQRLFPHSRFAQFASAASMIQALSTVGLGYYLGGVLDRSGHLYRITFVAGLIMSSLAVVFFLIVNQLFVRLGGSKHYVAPE